MKFEKKNWILLGLVAMLCFTGFLNYKFNTTVSDSPQVAMQAPSSTAEQRAMSVERSCEDCYKAEYMSSHLGESYEGMVSGVIERGIFVELPNTVEGMIRISEMPGHFEYDGKIEVKDKDSGRRFRIGDRIRIKVARTDVSSGEIDFVLDETTLFAEQD